ncbi:MAG TPA: hypothetical protein VEU30_04115, partial [Thermoanaerobaculia bacterium]|nr:hypothetical protein [Thermoanaerobaculia bacterium]
MRRLLSLLFLLLAPAAFASDALSPDAARIDRWLAEASAEFDVPLEVLQAVAFVESRWTQLQPSSRRFRDADHQLQPGAFGVMGLRDDPHFGYSLRDAAALIQRTPAELIEDPRLNIRGAAALLQKYSGGATRASSAEAWEAAVALYSGIPERGIAEMYTYDVFTAILSGRASDRF